MLLLLLLGVISGLFGNSSSGLTPSGSLSSEISGIFCNKFLSEFSLLIRAGPEGGREELEASLELVGRLFMGESELISAVLLLLSLKSLEFWFSKGRGGKTFPFSCFLFPKPKKFKVLSQKESSFFSEFAISWGNGSGGGNCGSDAE